MLTLRGSRGTDLLCLIVSLKTVKILLLTQILTKALTFAVSTQNNQSRTSHTHYKRPRDAQHYENTDLKAEPILKNSLSAFSREGGRVCVCVHACVCLSVCVSACLPVCLARTELASYISI